MNELDKIIFMQNVGDFLKLYETGLKSPMAHIVDDKKLMNDKKLMTPAHAGMVELASYHLARAYGELGKLFQDWSITHDKEEQIQNR